MSLHTYANNVRSTLAAALTQSATSLTLSKPEAPYEAPPKPTADRPGVLTITGNPTYSATHIEVVAYTGRTVNGNGSITLTGLTRGYDDTAARPWDEGSIAYQALTAGALNELGTASQVDTGTGASQVPTTSQADARFLNRSNNLNDLGSSSAARGNLGLGALATLDQVSNSLFTGSLSIAHGGTGATSASGARSKLGLSAVAVSGSYDDLSGTPVLKSVALSGSYNDLTNLPALKPVATSGSYGDLTDTPSLGSAAAKNVGYFASASQGTKADNALPANQLGVAGGAASLNSASQLKADQIPASLLGQVDYQGGWDASTGNAPSANPVKGQYWIVTTAGSTNIGGFTDWKVGDWAIYNGAVWAKVDNTDAVVQVAGLVGTISSASLRNALAVNLTDNTSDADKPVSTAQQAALDTKLDKTANAVSATQLKTARTISGMSFNGTANITIPYGGLSGRPALGTASAKNVGYFATASQGTKADSAVQPDDLGTASAKDAGFFIAASEKAAANGVAPLDSTGHVASSYLPQSMLGALNWQSTWDASTGNPPASSPQKGWYYTVNKTGNTSLSGITDWNVGDWAIYNGAVWAKVDNTDHIISVAGLSGTISSAALRSAMSLDDVLMPGDETYGYRQALGATEDLNDLTRPGIYTNHQNAYTSVAHHYPIAYAGVLEVQAVPDRHMVWQRYTTYNDNGVYIRRYYNGWTSWKRVFVSGDLIPANNITHLSGGADWARLSQNSSNDDVGFSYRIDGGNGGAYWTWSGTRIFSCDPSGNGRFEGSLSTGGTLDANEIRSTLAMSVRDAGGGGNYTQCPRIFVESGDPGSRAYTGDLWMW